MKRLFPVIVAVSAVSAVVAGSGASAAGVARSAGSWGRAIEVPGLGALNTGGRAGVNSVSCGSAGNCVAGGDFRRSSGDPGFVVSERNGVWGKAIEVPGLRALGGNAGVSSVSCASAGNCVAGGDYADRRSGFYQGFVAVERDGVWGQAIEVPGLAALNAGGDAGVSSVSCASAGACAAGGGYRDRRGHGQGFVVSEKNGRWGQAIEVPGLGALNMHGFAGVNSVSCGSAGNCAAGGVYYVGTGRSQGFVTAERHGRWGTAIEVPGLGALNKRFAEVMSVSCASAGNCAAGGDYDARPPYREGFVVVERNGVWGRAIEVPGLGALNTGANAFITSVSCAAPGNCAVGGGYADRRGQQGFVAVERDGRWGKAIAVPGLRALNAIASAAVFSVSCAPHGNCAAGGGYEDRRGRSQGFVVSQAG